MKKTLLAGLLAVAAGLFPAAADGVGDDAIARFLREGAVVSKEEIGSGVTRPFKVVLEHDGERMKAAFKTVSIHLPGVTSFPDGTKEIDFSDDYRYELAAYLLDRRLGLEMVPVTVVREIEGQPGALIEWVEDATTETKRMERAQAVPEPLRRQRSMMVMFDALIANVDRHGGNELITADGKLHLIDHSRSFRRQRKLPASFEKTPSGLTRDVLHELEALDRDALADLLGALLTKPQLDALLRRRDGILKKIRADLTEYGEAVVLWERDATDQR